MRIAIVVNSFPTISETFITNKVLNLCARGHQVTVVTHKQTDNASLVNLYKLNQYPTLTVATPAIPSSPLQWLQLLASQPAVLLGQLGQKGAKGKVRDQLLLSSLTSQPFDIIHFEFSALALLYKNILPALKPPTVVSCRGTAEKVKPLTIPGRIQQLAELFSVIKSIHCVSADMARTVEGYGAAPDKIFINRPSIDVSFFTPVLPKGNGHKMEILTIGRFTFQKGYLVGLLAVKKLQVQGIPFHWNIVGDGPVMEEVIFHIHTLGLTSQVSILGKKNKEEILSLYNASQVFLLSSVYEGIANVVLEAMAMQLPVVTTKSGGLEEVIEHEVDGMLANLYDHDALASHLVTLYNNVDKRIVMGERARQKILDQFTIARQTDEFEARYTALLQTKTTSL